MHTNKKLPSIWPISMAGLMLLPTSITMFVLNTCTRWNDKVMFTYVMPILCAINTLTTCVHWNRLEHKVRDLLVYSESLWRVLLRRNCCIMCMTCSVIMNCQHYFKECLPVVYLRVSTHLCVASETVNFNQWASCPVCEIVMIVATRESRLSVAGWYTKLWQQLKDGNTRSL